MNIIIRKLNIFYIINKYKPRLIYFKRYKLYDYANIIIYKITNYRYFYITLSLHLNKSHTLFISS